MACYVSPTKPSKQRCLIQKPYYVQRFIFNLYNWPKNWSTTLKVTCIPITNLFICKLYFLLSTYTHIQLTHYDARFDIYPRL